MRNQIWAYAVVAASVLVTGYSLLEYMRHNNMPIPAPQATVSTAKQELATGVPGNPLLTARKTEISRWFPGSCFAELYMAQPSFGGRLIPGCFKSVIREIKAETGITLTEADVRSPEVVEHFKQVYGQSGSWRQ